MPLTQAEKDELELLELEEEEAQFQAAQQSTQPAESTPAPQDGVAQTATDAAVGLGKGLSLNLSDEGAGVGAAAANVVQQGKELLGVSENPDSETSRIQRVLDAFRAGKSDQQITEEEAQANSPISFGASQFAGSLPARVAASAVAGPVAGEALVAGIEGTSEGGIGQGLKNAAIGAAAGKVLGSAAARKLAGSAGKAIGKVGSKAADAGTETLRRTIFKPAELGKLVKGRGIVDEGIDKGNKISQTLIREGIFNKGLSKQNLLRSAKTIENRAGDQLDNLYAQLPEARVTADRLITKFDEKAFEIEKKFKGKGAINQLAEARENLLKNWTDGAGDIDVLNLWQAKKNLGTEAFKNQVGVDLSGKQEAFFVVRDLLEETIEQTAPGALELIKKQNRVFSAAKSAGEALFKRVEEEGARNTVSLGGTIAGITTPSKFGEFAPLLQAAAKKGANSFKAQYFVLSQRDEKFRKITTEINKEEE